MRKIVLNLAMSLDGYIADTDGGFDWIVGQGDDNCDTEKQFDFHGFVESVDTIVMGRKAYEDSGELTMSTMEDIAMKRFIVATSRPLEAPDNVETFNGDICAKILALREEEGKDIWLFGGAGVTDQFVKANIVDEYIIGIIPVILGKGRRLFNAEYSTIELRLEEITVADGVTMLRYTKRGKR